MTPRPLSLCTKLMRVAICGAAFGAVALVGAPIAQAKTTTQKAKEPAKGVPDIAFETTRGTFVVRLFDKEAPLSSQNLLQYVDEKFYDGLIFHRVIPGFMVQGGGFDKDLKEKDTQHKSVTNEAGRKDARKNTRGTLAMARTRDPDSARAQFFVNVVDNPMLDANAGSAGYAVVGEVISGMEVVDAIRSVKTRCASQGGAPEGCAGLPPGMQDVPEEPVIIKAARRQPRTAGK